MMASARNGSIFKMVPFTAAELRVLLAALDLAELRLPRDDKLSRERMAMIRERVAKAMRQMGS